MKVVVFGASGETGRSLVDGLLASPVEFAITAVTRESSLNSKKNEELRGLGVNVVAADLKGPKDDLVRLLKGTDIVISAVNAAVLLDQMPLADAAKDAGVGRFVPCTFATAAPPRGVMKLREMKEDVLDHVKKIYLPYTMIDVGWWFQISAPPLPSGRIDYAVTYPFGDRIIGDGNAPLARTHVRDIGRYVARIVADPRTLNRAVFAYSEVLTDNEVREIIERLSGETLGRKYLPEAELEAQISQAEKAVSGGTDPMATEMLFVLQYARSWGIRGDNSPEHARYLGYLIGKDLYPDMVDFTTFEGHVNEMLEGKARKVYS